MGLFDSVKEKLSRDPPPLENAIKEIAKKIRDDVMSGNYDEAKAILEKNLRELENGDFEKRVTDDDGKYLGYDRNWPAPEEEAQQLTNFVFLELLEMSVEDLETVEGQLEPPIKVYDALKNRETELENGIEGEVQKLEEFLNDYNKQDVKNMSRKKFKRFRKKGYKHAYRIRLALGTKSAQGAKDAVNNEKYRTKPRREQSSEGKYKENMGVLITVKTTERHLKFIQQLAEWEHREYGLDMDQNEMGEVKEVKKWLGERYEIIKELDEIIHPFVLDRGAEAGITKDEAFKNPDESLERLSKADQVLEQLHEFEEQEDQKIKQLDNMLP